MKKLILTLCFLLFSQPALAYTTTQVTVASRTINKVTPDSVPSNQLFPLLVVLHGGAGSAAVIQAQLGLDPYADSNKIFLAYPNGTMIDSNPLMRVWNSGNCCSTAKTNNVNDVAFITAVVNYMIANHPIDSTKVYIAGLSNGGMMALRYMCERPDKIAGAMEISSIKTTTGYCSTAINRPLLSIHGALDDITPLAGGETIEVGYTFPPYQTMVNDFQTKGVTFETVILGEAGHSVESLNEHLDVMDTSIAKLITDRVK